MATTVELINSQTFSRDRVYRFQAQRRWKIFGGDISASDVLQNLTTYGLPSYGEPWEDPGGQAVFLDSYDITPNDNVLDVVANYSSNGAFKFPPRIEKVNGIASGWKSWTGSRLDEKIRFPFARKTPMRVGTETIEWWQPDSMDVQVTMRIHSRTVVLSHAELLTALAVMDVQNNRLHFLPDGRAYRFEAGSYSEFEPGVWEVSYSWIYDPGHITMRTSYDQDNIPLKILHPGNTSRRDPDGLIQYDGWVRQPFCEFFIRWYDSGGGMTSPAFEVFRPYDWGNRGGAEPGTPTGDGWIDLPGDPL